MIRKVEQNNDREVTTIIADNGKLLRRKGTDDIYGEIATLGYSYYIGGVLQNPPHLDVPDDFEEIDKPVEEPVEEQELPDDQTQEENIEDELQ